MALSNKNRPGLLIPVGSSASGGSVLNSRWSLVNNGTTDIWDVPNSSNSDNPSWRASLSRGESNIIANNTNRTSQPQGAQLISYLSVSTAIFSAKQIVEWLMNLEDIKTAADANTTVSYAYNNKGTGSNYIDNKMGMNQNNRRRKSNKTNPRSGGK
jgi:hypothetical protein